MRRLVLLFLLLACSRDPRDSVIVRRLEADVVSLNPLRVRTGNDPQLIHLLYTPLLYLDRNDQVIPALATRWSVTPDGLEYTFELDRRATWSDGAPVTSKDVLYTLKAITTPQVQSPLLPRFDQLDLSRTRTPGSHTIVIRFRNAVAAQLTNFASLYVVAAHSRADEKDALTSTALGSGPYVLEHREIGKSITLHRREGYWREPARIERVRFNVVEDNNTAWNAVRLGDLDESIVSNETWNRERGVTRTDDVRFLQFYFHTYNFIVWNCERAGLDDPRARMALAQAIDTSAIIQHLFHGAAKPLNGPFIPGSWSANPEVAPIAFDPAEARAALAALGWTAARPLRLELLVPSGSRTTSAVAEIVQSGLKSVGVEARVTQLDSAAYFERILAGDFDAAYLAWDLDVDPDPYNLFHSASSSPRGRNFGRYSNPRVDQLLEKGRAARTRDERRRIYFELHRLLAAEQPYAWLLQPAVTWAFNGRVQNVRTSNSSGLFLWYPADLEWTLKPDRHVKP